MSGIFIVIVLALAALAAFIARRPSEFAVARTAFMAAPPAAVFAQVNDFRKWEAWSPWAKLDPQSRVDFDGAPSGEGAVMRWSGNNKVGEGALTIVEARAPELIRMRLDFIKPFRGTSDTEFRFAPEGGGTRVSWSMRGHNNFIAKAMSLVMNCEKMVGAQYDKGLAAMKAIVEAKA